MKTVKEISQLTGASVRTLHHYDAIGLLKPTKVTDAGYRLYDEEALKQLCLILLYRELGFSLRKIGNILSAPDFDRNRALEEQIRLMEQKQRSLQNRITLARGIKLTGVNYMSFDNFDAKKIDDYSAQAEALWGQTPAYQEFREKSKGKTREQLQASGAELTALFTQIASFRGQEPDSKAAQAWVAQLQAFITEHYYTCTKPMLACLGDMYAGGGSMTENIDAAGGSGAGAFAKAAIDIFCAE